jgi:hypothetical protein
MEIRTKGGDSATLRIQVLITQGELEQAEALLVQAIAAGLVTQVLGPQAPSATYTESWEEGWLHHLLPVLRREHAGSSPMDEVPNCLVGPTPTHDRACTPRRIASGFAAGSRETGLEWL